MNENDNEPITTEAELLPAELFDFDFITSSLNLLPICGGNVAINVSMVADIERDDDGSWIVTLQHGSGYTLTDGEMAELEQNLKQRIEYNKHKAKETFKENIRIQAEAAQELQSGVQQVGGVIVEGHSPKRGRFTH